jgi:hypothetical protein
MKMMRPHFTDSIEKGSNARPFKTGACETKRLLHKVRNHMDQKSLRNQPTVRLNNSDGGHFTWVLSIGKCR